MAKFIAPTPMVFNGKLREIINLEQLTSFTFLKSVQNNYGFIRFSFDKGNDLTWAYPDDETLRRDLVKIYGLLDLEWTEHEI
ncbi:MAG: hypothetical protein EOO68_27490 [Moraxellaceae bacterium]|nr:MAG: hypothetical protein EOO68_27490 [Moraxellaceae bacterium]